MSVRCSFYGCEKNGQLVSPSHMQVVHKETFNDQRATALAERYEALRRDDPESFKEAIQLTKSLATNHDWSLMEAAAVEAELIAFAHSVRDRNSR